MVIKNGKASVVNEVGFVNHFYEFARFYDRHKELCDELSGMKKVVNRSRGGEDERNVIDAENFHFAISKLHSFLIDNMHYINSMTDREGLQKSIFDLETRYQNDNIYFELARQSRGIDSEILFKTKYFNYLLECFEIAGKIMTVLQTSLMISPKSIRKSIVYHDDSKFFVNLGQYRDEVSDNLADFKCSTALDHTRKVIGYYETYNLFMDLEQKNDLDKLIKLLVRFLLEENQLKIIVIAMGKNGKSASDLKEIFELASYTRKVLSFIYVRTNECLQEKRIMLKRVKQEFIDKTGM